MIFPTPKYNRFENAMSNIVDAYQEGSANEERTIDEIVDLLEEGTEDGNQWIVDFIVGEEDEQMVRDWLISLVLPHGSAELKDNRTFLLEKIAHKIAKHYGIECS